MPNSLSLQVLDPFDGIGFTAANLLQRILLIQQLSLGVGEFTAESFDLLEQALLARREYKYPYRRGPSYLNHGMFLLISSCTSRPAPLELFHAVWHICTSSTESY